MKIENAGNNELDNDIFEDAEETISIENVPSIEDLTESAVSELEKKSKETTKTGRKSKNAKEAEEQKLLISTCQSFFEGIHEVALNKFGEAFRHEDEEINTLAILTSAVIAKHFDLHGLEWKEEIQLATYLAGKELPKIQRYIDENREKTKAKNV